MRTVWALMALGVTSGVDVAEGQSLRDVFGRVNPSVVLIEAKTPAPSSLGGAKAEPEHGVGSGVLISADGKVLTAAHVVRGANEITARFMTGDPISARVVATAPFADVALLQLATVPAGATAAAFGDSDALQIGDQVFTIGAPYGANHSLAVGWISARRTPDAVYEDATALEVFQTDLSIYEGNSGGPLFNVDGQVVGIVTHVLAKDGAATGPSFSVTGNVARKLMIEQRRTWFGVESVMLDGDLAQAFQLPAGAGLLVQSVADGSLADRLGIREGNLPSKVGELSFLLGGDIVLEVHGVPVSSTPEFFAAFTSTLDRIRPGDTVTTQVWRGGKVVTLRATAAER